MGTCFNKFLKWYNDFPSVISSTKKIFTKGLRLKTSFTNSISSRHGRDESMRFSGIGKNPYRLIFFEKRLCLPSFFRDVKNYQSPFFVPFFRRAYSQFINDKFSYLIFSFFREFVKQTIILFFYKFQIAFFLSELKFRQISRYFSVSFLLFLREILFISINNPGAMAPKVIIPPVYNR